MAKPTHILAAMDRHPHRTIIFLDVDCEVRGDLAPLAEIGGDVGFYMRTKWRRSGGMKAGARSGTVVIKPTAAGRRYIEAWVEAAAEAPWGDVDQTPQMIAMGRARCAAFRGAGTSFTMLGVEWCATAGDKVAAPIILHDSASRGIRKISRFRRRLRRWMWPLRATRGQEEVRR